MMSLLGKRANPFADHFGNPQPKQLKPDMQFIYERTMNLLMSSSERYSRPTEKTPKYYSPPDTPIDSIESLVNDVFGGTCYVCNRVPSPSSEMTCNFCSNTCCDTCARQCESCGYIYCSFCSTVNYDLRYDRIFCLDCNHEEQQRLKWSLQQQQTTRKNEVDAMNLD